MTEQLWNTPGMLGVVDDIVAQGAAIASEQESLLGLIHGTSAFQEGANKDAYTMYFQKWGAHLKEFTTALHLFAAQYAEIATNKATSETAKAGQWL